MYGRLQEQFRFRLNYISYFHALVKCIECVSGSTHGYVGEIVDISDYNNTESTTIYNNMSETTTIYNNMSESTTWQNKMVETTTFDNNITESKICDNCRYFLQELLTENLKIELTFILHSGSICYLLF